MAAECSFLFAYGTLRDSNVNHKAHFLRELAHFVTRGHIRARLYKVTWYPAIRLYKEGEDRVYGDIYELPLATREMVLHELDGYEGIYSGNEDSEEYERVLTTATLEDGSTLECWVYNYKMDLDEKMRIRSGDYLRYLRELQ